MSAAEGASGGGDGRRSPSEDRTDREAAARGDAVEGTGDAVEGTGDAVEKVGVGERTPSGDARDGAGDR